jgi:hypothetical protein
MDSISGSVIAVCSRDAHLFSKENRVEIELIKNFGINGDAHAGMYVKHRSRVKKNPKQLNLRQVHLIPIELLNEMKQHRYDLHPGDLGENITTSGIDLINLPLNSQINIGEEVVLEVKGLRDPCKQIEAFKEGLLKKMITKDADGNLIRKTGIMTIVLEGGIVKPNDKIEVVLPKKPYHKLEVV